MEGELAIPENLAAAARAEGRQPWLAALPGTIRSLATRWSIDVGPPFRPGGHIAWVAPAARDGADLVVKVLWRHPDAEQEAEGLRVWDGDGAVRLHAAETVDAETAALLLERCRVAATGPETRVSTAVRGRLRVEARISAHILWRGGSARLPRGGDMNAKLDMGPIGVFTRVQVWQSAPDAAEAAAELEDLGFSALWLGGSPGGDLEVPESLVRATRRLVVGTSIVNIWKDAANVVAASYHRIASSNPGRFVLGIGIGHAANVGDAYRRPMRKLSEYLDELDAASPPAPAEGRAVAALGPRSLAIARERSLGSLPYLVTPEHTRMAREALGPDALLAPEQKVVLGADPAAALPLARQQVAPYLRLPNYTNNLRRLGYGDHDFADGGSERLVAALVASGDAEIRARIRQHFDAGATHVAVQVLTPDRERLPREQFRALAAVVRDLARVT